MTKPSKSASSLRELINHAIRDLEVTPDEYNRIIDCAHDDSHIDNEERALLSQFQEMLNDGTIKRIKG